MYVDENGVPCGGASCNYCSGSIVQAPDGMYQFIHEDACVFRTEYGSEFGEEDMNGNEIEEDYEDEPEE